MFTKVLKYELTANGRVLLPAYVFGVAGALLLRLLAWLFTLASATVGAVADQICQGIVMLYAVALALFSIGYVVVRFYRTMVSREAYLTLTLPVKITTHIWAKFLAGFLFSILGLLACIVTINAYDLTGFDLGGLASRDAVPILLTICLILILLAYVIMEAYFCCAVGSQFKSKVLASVVTYFVAHNALGILIVAIIAPVAVIMERSGYLETLMRQITSNPYSATGSFALLTGLVAVFCGIIFTIQFLVGRRLLTKKLNLE